MEDVQRRWSGRARDVRTIGRLFDQTSRQGRALRAAPPADKTMTFFDIWNEKKKKNIYLNRNEKYIQKMDPGKSVLEVWTPKIDFRVLRQIATYLLFSIYSVQATLS